MTSEKDDILDRLLHDFETDYHITKTGSVTRRYQFTLSQIREKIESLRTKEQP